MIYSLHIKNYLLIEQIELDFQQGLTVITGETGAGKSLIIDSLELALGARAEPGVVRQGCTKAEINLCFDAAQPNVRDWLDEQDLYEDREGIIKRIIFTDRPSKAYVNGQPVTLNLVKDLASRMIAVHGQSEHHSLQKTATQRSILDGFANIAHLTKRLAELCSAIRSAESERAKRADEQSSLNAQLELLEHQHNTLVELDPLQGEFSELKQDLVRNSHAVETAATLGDLSYQLYYGDETTLSGLLADGIGRIEQLALVDESLKHHAEILYEAQMRVDDVARELNAIAERTEHDPAQMTAIEERMAALQQQARVHNTDADELLESMAALEQRITKIRTAVDELVSVDASIDQFKSEYQRIASQVSDARLKAADQLGRAVTENMQQLGMAGGRFSVSLIAQQADSFTSYGSENVSFVVVTAPGQEPGPLGSITSGGELSRLSLAIQVVAANTTQVPSIVFDEIDVGIGGSVAERVGELLRLLGKSVQIFCITHLPQVAAKGDQQLNVEKMRGETSSVKIQQLDDQQRVMEIARMLSGAKITDRTTEHAREMLAESSI